MTIRGGCMKQKYEIESMSIWIYAHQEIWWYAFWYS